MKSLIVTLTVCLLSSVTLQAQMVTYNISGGTGNLVKFESIAPMETVVGTSDEVKGNLSFDPLDLSKGINGSIVVSAASLKTGNTIRDGHMKNNHLETDKYPDITFTITDAKVMGRLLSGEKSHFEIPGDFSLHGVTKPIIVSVDATVFQENSIQKVHLAASFQVGLSDYSIVRPQFLVMKLDEIQHITVDIWGAAQ